MNRSWHRKFIIAISAVLLVGAKANAGTCQLVWRITESGAFDAQFSVPPGAKWARDHLPEPVQNAQPRTNDGGITFEARGELADPEKSVGQSTLEWLRSRISSPDPGSCEKVRVELRTEWRYQEVPSDSLYQYPEGGDTMVASLSIRRLSSITDNESKREYFGVELEETPRTGKPVKPSVLQDWVTEKFDSTDLRAPGLAWRDRPEQVRFPTGLRAEVAFVAGSYAPGGQANFGAGVRGGLTREWSLSNTWLLRANFLGFRGVFGEFSSLGGDLIGLSIYDFHLDAGLHWRPSFQANDTSFAGIRTFVDFSVTPGIHRVFSKSDVPSPVNQAFTAPAADFGFAWGAYNRKKDILLALDFHFVNYLNVASYGPSFEFGFSISAR